MPTENQITLNVVVNGESRSFPAASTLLDIVRALGLEPERLAIEFNRAIVKREFWTSTAIGEGSEIEIVQFVGGG
jgi:thiamine biosynthesis protein ThiS